MRQAKNAPSLAQRPSPVPAGEFTEGDGRDDFDDEPWRELAGGGISESADDEDRLARAARPAAAFEGLPPFGQREGLADHRSQPSRAGHLRQPG
jgi:hypothetical protein